MLRRNSGFENLPKLGDWRALPMSGINRERSTYNNQLEQSLAVTCTFYEKEGARAFCQHVTLCNCGGLPASTTTVKNANPKVGTPMPMLKRHHHGSTAMARHPGRAMACQLIRRALQPQKQLFITGEVLSKAGCSQQKVFLHSTDRT